VHPNFPLIHGKNSITIRCAPKREAWRNIDQEEAVLPSLHHSAVCLHSYFFGMCFMCQWWWCSCRLLHCDTGYKLTCTQAKLPLTVSGSALRQGPNNMNGVQANKIIVTVTHRRCELSHWIATKLMNSSGSSYLDFLGPRCFSFSKKNVKNQWFFFPSTETRSVEHFKQTLQMS